MSAILAGICLIEPIGSKYGFGEKVRFARSIRTSSVIAGLRDRDFDQDDSIPTNDPIRWNVDNNTCWLGWYWERLEIENYLLDPEVVRRALGAKAPAMDAYQSALQQVAESIVEYTAARIALSMSRIRLNWTNKWGRRRGRDRYVFPDDRSEADCRSGIQDIVRQLSEMMKEGDVLNRFDELLPFCRPEGRRFQYFLTFFSGKDLLCGMEQPLIRFGFQSPFSFRESILKGIENSPEDVWTWLPEWQRLREQISSISSNDGT